MSAEPEPSHAKPPFLKRVRIRNYKSIKFCDVELEPFTILVGRNGSGKSNFVDALGFLRDVMKKGIQEAVKIHGGRDTILCQSDHTVSSFVGIEVEVCTEGDESDDSWIYTLSFELALPFAEAPRVVREQLQFRSSISSFSYRTEAGRLVWNSDCTAGKVDEWFNLDKLYASYAKYIPFGKLEQALGCIESYNFTPHLMRPPQKPLLGVSLLSDGSNLASVIQTTRHFDENAIERVRSYLSIITERISFADVIQVGGYDVILFNIIGDGPRYTFPAETMSDGTLRAFAALVAVFQQTAKGQPSLVAIEEPETSLHPAATAALVDALDEATGRTQIVITTHSTELLDNPTIQPKNVRVVEMIDGETIITGVDEATEEIVRKRYDTLGGLERQNQLHINFDDQERQYRLAGLGGER